MRLVNNIDARRPSRIRIMDILLTDSLRRQKKGYKFALATTKDVRIFELVKIEKYPQREIYPGQVMVFDELAEMPNPNKIKITKTKWEKDKK